MKVKKIEQQDFREKSYWLTTRHYTPNENLKGEVTCDVAVIGGGFTGLSSAYFLKKAQPEIDVALLEGQVIGFGASGRNAGFSMTKFGLIHSITAFRFGNQKTVEAHEYTCRAVDLLRDLVTTLDLDCDYQHTGFLEVSTCKVHQKRLAREFEFVTKKLGLKDIFWIDEQELQSRVASPLYEGGAWWEPRCGILNPAKLAWSWKEVIEPLGVRVFENSPLIEIAREGGRFRLVTPEGHVRANKVVLATNAWSSLFAKLKRKQVPVWTYIVLTEPLNERQHEEIGWQGREGIEDFRDLVHYYRLTADNRIVLGGRDVDITFGYDVPAAKDQNPKVFDGLKSDLLQVFPSLQGIAFTHQWGGPVSVPLDMAPAMGYAGGKDLVYSLGCMGHAVSLTHLNGMTIADLVLERDTELTRTFFVNRRVIPYPPEPFRTATAKAIAGYMRWDDGRHDKFSMK
ncbi:MAG: FAD-dependent oxidoreductase [Bradymonadales bacterium]|nr:FAD-dependent oxidoreductase [Bradymonadales bacterium]